MKLLRTDHPGPDGIQLRAMPPIEYLFQRLSVLHPAYFAMVMATGIVAIGAHLQGLDRLAGVLAALNALAYPLLWMLLVLRIFLFPGRVWADCTSHQRAPGYFTLVAATGVVGVQAVLLHGNLALAQGLWWFAVGLWALTTYGVFGMLITRKSKPTLAAGINGGWLVSIVATQAVVVLGCTAGATLLGGRERTLFVLLCFWLCGGLLYLWIISLIFYRYLFFEFSPGDLMPPYWINMGAVAISTLAGALLTNSAAESPMLQPLVPFMKGIMVIYWASATWWIPMLVFLGIWRHVVCRFPLVYDPLYWGLVFPLGMYGVCTIRMSETLGAAFLVPVARVFIVVAAVAWTLAFLGLARRFVYFTVLALRSYTRTLRRTDACAATHHQEENPDHEYLGCPDRV
jgi:tellurite resistance protein TehA-like permease